MIYLFNKIWHFLPAIPGAEISKCFQKRKMACCFSLLKILFNTLIKHFRLFQEYFSSFIYLFIILFLCQIKILDPTNKGIVFSPEQA